MHADEERLYGLWSPYWNSVLRRSAARERKQNLPTYPHITCGNLECDHVAKEGWFFCSSECRDAFVREWVNESDTGVD